MKLLFSFFMFMGPALAQAGFFSAELAAQSTAEFLNHAKTFRGFTDSLAFAMTPEEVEGVRQLFSEMKVQMDTKIPKATAVGNKVTFDKYKEVIEFKNDRTFAVDGRVYKYNQPGSLDRLLRNAAESMGAKEVGLMSLILPQASAQDIGAELAMGIRLLAVGSAASAVVIGTVLIYGGKEIYETMKNNSIQCDGPYFKLRTKKHNLVLLATSKENILDPQKINQIFGEKVACDHEKAEKLQSMIKAEPAKGQKLLPGSSAGGTK